VAVSPPNVRIPLVEAEIRTILGFEWPMGTCAHHESHARSAFYWSGLDDAAILTVDGVGEWATMTVGRWEWRGFGAAIQAAERRLEALTPRSVAESDEANNCVASPAVLTVTRPDLVASAMSNPPATAPRGSKFSVTDTAQNVSAVGAASSKMRYYLSLNAVKSADDRLMTTSRSVPALAAGAVHSGTVVVTVPSGTPANSYFVLACADGYNAVEEASEDNNCRASATQVTVAP